MEQNYSKDFKEVKELLKTIKKYSFAAYVFAASTYVSLAMHSCTQKTRYEDFQSRLQRIEQAQSNLVERVGGNQ